MFATWIGVVLLFAFFGLLALVVIGASPRGNTYEEKRAKDRADKLQAMQQEKIKALTAYAWVDKNKGMVRIPITDAMKLTVAELAGKAPVSAGPIATPAANPPAQTAAPTTASPAPAAVPPSVPLQVPVSPPASPSPPLPVHGKTP
jgi:hypothetical protein